MKALIALALLSGSALAQAEGAGPRAWLLRILPKPQAPLSKKAAVACPTNDAEWRTWRDAWVKELLTLKSGPVRYLALEDVMSRSTEIVKALGACKPAVPPAAIMGNFVRFVTTQHNANYLTDLSHQFGHTVSDHEYLNLANPALELPCLLRSSHFLVQISHPKGYFDAFKLIKNQNEGKSGPVAGCPPDGRQWDTLIYKSRFLPTPDYAETLGRFFVRVPGDDYDRWIQFGIWLPEDSKRYDDTINNVSVVAVAKGDDPQAHKRFDALADWWRVPVDNSFDLELRYRRMLQPFQTDNCLRCHKTVPIGLHPLKVYKFDERSGKLKAILGARKFDAAAALNSKIFQEYARRPIYKTDPDNDSFADPANYGPPFGPDKDLGAPVRTPESLRACTAPHRLSQASIRNVIDNMNCAACHNGKKSGGFGLLNYPLATEKRTGKTGDSMPNLIRSHILSTAMPIDEDKGEPVRLLPSERAALYDCLSREYFDPTTNTGVFVDWLKNKDTSVTATSVSRTVPSPGKFKAGAAPLAASGVVSGPPAGFDQCVKCHKNSAPPKAPSLIGVYQRQLAGDPNFGRYSPDLKAAAALKDAANANIVWDEANLMAFLKDPDAFLADKLGNTAAESNMAKRYADEVFRRTIVQYLMTLK